MKVMVVASPHAFSTRDVYTGHVAGLRSVLGDANVVTYDIIPRYNMFASWAKWIEEQNGFVPRELRANVLAAEPVFAAAHMHEVDAVYFISPMYFPMTIVEMLRKDGFKCWATFTECPYEDDLWTRGQAHHFDACFVNDQYSVNRFRLFNENTHYLAHAYNPAVHYAGRGPKAGHDHVVYVGTPFPRRRAFLEQAEWEGVDLRLYGFWDEDGSLIGSPLTPYIRPRLVRNEFTARIYRGAAIGISMHRLEMFWDTEGDILQGEAYSLGPRAFELAACGLFQLSDERPELYDIFGDTVPTFRQPDGLGALVRKYLDDPVRRQELAKKQREAVEPHTVQARMAQLLELAA